MSSLHQRPNAPHPRSDGPPWGWTQLFNRASPPPTGAPEQSNAGLHVLLARKRSEHALIAATGLSTGRLTREQSAFLMARTDVWGVNQIFLHHDLVPAFYNLEMRTLPMDGRKDRSKTVSSEMMWKLFDASKRAAYRDTVFLARTEHAADVRRVLTSADRCPRALVTYTCQNKLSDCNERRLLTRSRVRPLDASGGMLAVVSEFCGSSISRVFDLIVRLRYRTISLVGVELNSQHHFYTSLPNYAEVAQRLPVQWERSMLAFVRRANRNTTLHATATRGIQHYIDALGHFYAGRLTLFNLSPESLLRTAKHVETALLPAPAAAEGNAAAALDAWWSQHQLRAARAAGGGGDGGGIQRRAKRQPSFRPSFRTPLI